MPWRSSVVAAPPVIAIALAQAPVSPAPVDDTTQTTTDAAPQEHTDDTP